MTITKTSEGTALTLALEGRLDTTTAPQLEAELKTCLDGIKSLTMDMSSLSYLSSAGLRVILAAQKKMSRAQWWCVMCVRPLWRSLRSPDLPIF